MKIIPKELKEKIKQLNDEGLSFKEISEKVNVSAKTVSKIVKEFEQDEKNNNEVQIVAGKERANNPLTVSTHQEINNLKVKFELCCNTISSVVDEGLIDKGWVENKLFDYDLVTCLASEEYAESEYERGISDFKEKHSLNMFSDGQLTKIMPQMVDLWNWMVDQGIKPENILTHFKLTFESNAQLGALKLEKEMLIEEIKDLQDTLKFKEDSVMQEIYRLNCEFEKFQKDLNFRYKKIQNLQQVVTEDEARMKEVASLQQEIEALRRTIMPAT